MSTTKSASHYFNINQPPLVEIAQDSDPEKGLTLKANQDIPAHVPVVLYYGKAETPGDNIQSYFNDPEDYIQNQGPYIRALTKDRSINAGHLIPIQDKTNLNLLGVLVNDVSKPTSLKALDLIEYLKTEEQCNLTPSHQTSDYPLYVSTREIKKGEVLTVHYGLGYWLLQMGIPPEGIPRIIQAILSHLNQVPISIPPDPPESQDPPESPDP